MKRLQNCSITCFLVKRYMPKAMAIAAEIVENAAPVSVALSKAMLWHGLSEPEP